jgi:hypothetical protein
MEIEARRERGRPNMGAEFIAVCRKDAEPGAAEEAYPQEPRRSYGRARS